MDTLTTNATREIGIVFSQVDGTFMVLRFSKNGLQSAIAAMEDMIKRYRPSVDQSQKPSRQIL